MALDILSKTSQDTLMRSNFKEEVSVSNSDGNISEGLQEDRSVQSPESAKEGNAASLERELDVEEAVDELRREARQDVAEEDLEAVDTAIKGLLSVGNSSSQSQISNKTVLIRLELMVRLLKLEIAVDNEEEKVSTPGDSNNA
ncbi:hypothetical protein BDZ91DRAFT_803439 [Kalaharituber pfeilii]|nr:hypothetical protein BDZ91DRAFT_803439 [Kalaharituber pfeilii]